MSQASNSRGQDVHAGGHRLSFRTVRTLAIAGLILGGIVALPGHSQVRIQINGRVIGGPDFGSAPVNEWSDQMGRLLREGQGEPVYSKKIQRKLEQAEEALKSRENEAAITRLQEIIDAGEDAVREPPEQAGPGAPGEPQALPDVQPEPRPGQPRPAEEESIRRQADRLLENLPDAARRVYEAQYGPIARELAEQARDGLGESRRELLRRFRHTEAGLEFAFRDAIHQFDRGDYPAAVASLERLLRSPQAAARFGESLVLRLAAARYAAGDATGAARAIETGLTRKVELDVGGRLVTYDPDQPRGEAWLKELFGPQRNRVDSERLAAAMGMPPGRVVRSSAITPYLAIAGWSAFPLAAAMADGLQRGLEDRLADYTAQTTQIAVGQAMPLLPASQATLVGDTVVVPGVAGPIALDLMTGRVRWAAAERGSLLPRLRAAFDATTAQTSWPGELQDRSWLDQTVGSLSSDDERVYALSRHEAPQATVVPALGFDRNALPTDYCSLSALDARTGKLLWRIDPSARSADDPLLEVVFLGPPLPLDGQLYILGELSDRVSLFVFDAVTGRLEWMQPLTRLRQAIASGGGVHRRRGLSPSFGGGVLVCPTDAGVVVGIDPVERSFLWRAEYSVIATTGLVNNYNRAIVHPTSFPDGLRYYIDQLGWADNNALVDGDLTLIAPRSGGRLIALDTVTGTLRWVATPEAGLSIGGLTERTVVVVTRSGVIGLDRQTGAPAWRESLLRTGAPSGRGLLAGTTFHLPTVNGELVAIDTVAGTILRRDVASSGRALGNLLASRGTIVSLRPDGVTAYHDLGVLETQVAKALEKDQADPQARRMRAGLLVARGHLEEGVAAYRELMAAATGDESLREAYVAAMMEFARVRFPENESILQELETHLRSEPEKVRYYRMMADLHASRRNADGALEALLALVDLQFATRQLEPVSESWSVRPDRVVAGKAVDLFATVSAADRRRLAERIEQRVAVGDSDKRRPGPEDLRRHLSLFSEVSDTSGVRLRLAGQRRQQGEWQEAVHLLLGVLESEAGAKQRAEAVSSLFALLVEEIGRGRDAWRLLSDYVLADESAPQATREKIRALLAEMRADDPQGEDCPPVRWPTGQPEIVRQGLRASSPPNVALPAFRTMRPLQIPVTGDAGSWYDDLALSLDMLSKRLIATTPTGQEVWSATVAPLERLETEHKLFARGHLVILWDGAVLSAVDVSGTAEIPRPRVRWHRNLLAEVVALGIPEPQLNQLPNNLPARTDRDGRQFFAFGGGDLETFVYRMGSRLVCVDALRGDLLWQREGVPPGTNVVVAGGRVLLYGSSPKMTRMYRTLDGAEQPAPRDDWSGLLLHHGTRVVVVDSRPAEEGQPVRRVISAIDLKTGETTWNRPVSRRAYVQAIRARDVAIFEPQGQYTVVAGATGETLRRAELRLEFPAGNAWIWPQSERDIVFVGRGDGSEAPIAALLNTGSRRRVAGVNGKVFGVSWELARKTASRGGDDPLADGPPQPVQETTVWGVDCPGYLTWVDCPIDLPILFMNEEYKAGKKPPLPGGIGARGRFIPVDIRTGEEIATETDLDVASIPDGIETSLSQGTITVRVRDVEFVFKYGEPSQKDLPSGAPASEPPAPIKPEKK